MNSRSAARAGMPADGRKRRIANLSAAAAMIVGVGTASALFVDYLADRALARSVTQTAKPVAAPAETANLAAAPVEAQPAAQAAATPDAASVATSAPLTPEPIEAPLPDPSAIAKVAAGSPIDPSLDTQADAMDDPIAEEDPTATGAIAYADEPKAKKKQAPAAEQPKAAARAPAEPEETTEIASLPGVEIPGIPDASDDAEATASSGGNAGAGSVGGSARVRQAVNLRSSPKKGSSVVGVVPANSAVSVISCDGWCKVSFNGKTGWVYKSFLSGVTQAAAPQKSAAPAPAPKPAAPAPRRVQSSRL